ncbi:hypothetical protein BKA67DRAFT_337866 [Truncatella angustata]|uniref:Secreted protein n=1 Tax=Truncatella angustata TaxID=152316 RepID=A0A9P8ZUH7_9PEZI|nr:uncharacterized protein BKA67DRAFT_337866 [Truncatella angustata]KAH6651779.1 hypothetical protein BKA67DRAFT_337866 [Truncatella angustata]
MALACLLQPLVLLYYLEAPFTLRAVVPCSDVNSHCAAHLSASSPWLVLAIWYSRYSQQSPQPLSVRCGLFVIRSGIGTQKKTSSTTGHHTSISQFKATTVRKRRNVPDLQPTANSDIRAYLHTRQRIEPASSVTTYSLGPTNEASLNSRFIKLEPTALSHSQSH